MPVLSPEVVSEAVLDDAERRHAAALMRINHVGEVCPSPLSGQALSSANPALRAELEQAANEETEHLAWTEARIAALGGRKACSIRSGIWGADAWRCGRSAGRSLEPGLSR